MLSALTLLLMFTSICCEAATTEKEEARSNSETAMHLCSSMSKGVTELLVDDFVKRNGVKVQIRYLPEGSWQERMEFLNKNSFDCWLGGTVEECYLADQEGMLSPYKPKEFYKMPVELRTRQGQWTSIFLEYIAFVSNTNKLRDNGLYAPDTWQELLLPEFKNEISQMQNINIIEEASLSSDGVIVQSTLSRVDARISSQIDEIATRLINGIKDDSEQE